MLLLTSSLLAVGSHVLVSRDTSLDNLHVYTRSLASTFHGVVTLTSVHSAFHRRNRIHFPRAHCHRRNRPCHYLRAAAPTLSESIHYPLRELLQCACGAEGQTRTALTLVLHRCYNLDTALRSIPITWRVQGVTFPVEPSLCDAQLAPQFLLCQILKSVLA